VGAAPPADKPTAAEPRKPDRQLVQRAGVEAVVAVLALFAHGDEAVIAQHLEVLRDGRLADSELANQITHRDLAVATARLGAVQKVQEQLATGAVGKHVEDVDHRARVVSRTRGDQGDRAGQPFFGATVERSVGPSG